MSEVFESQPKPDLEDGVKWVESKWGKWPYDAVYDENGVMRKGNPMSVETIQHARTAPRKPFGHRIPAMVEQALAMLPGGAVTYLAEQAQANPKAFMALMAKCMPKSLEVKQEGPSLLEMLTKEAKSSQANGLGDQPIKGSDDPNGSHLAGTLEAPRGENRGAAGRLVEEVQGTSTDSENQNGDSVSSEAETAVSGAQESQSQDPSKNLNTDVPADLQEEYQRIKAEALDAALLEAKRAAELRTDAWLQTQTGRKPKPKKKGDLRAFTGDVKKKAGEGPAHGPGVDYPK